MDPFIVIFVAGLCVIAFFLTLAVRREFRAKERTHQHQSPAPRPTPRRRKS